MATQTIHIIDTDLETADGIVQTADKRNIGFAWQNEAPIGHFISCKLEDHWIITDEEYKEFRRLKSIHGEEIMLNTTKLLRGLVKNSDDKNLITIYKKLIKYAKDTN